MILMKMVIVSLTSVHSQTIVNPATRCGPNAAIMFLALIGLEPKQSAETIECGTKGASMLALKEYCIRNGFNVEIRQCSRRDYSILRMPAICQTSESNSSTHFVVLYRATLFGFYALDGTTGEDFFIETNKVSSYLSGETLVPSRPCLYSIVASPFAAVSSVLVFVLILLRFIFRPLHRIVKWLRRRRGSHSIQATLLSFCVCTVGPFAHSSEHEYNRIWRTHRNECINTLVMYENLTGQPLEYPDLSSRYFKDSSNSLRDLLLLAKKIRIPVEFRRYDRLELESKNFPLIVHLTGDDLNSGEFGILLARNVDKSFIFFSSASSTVAILDGESFFRRWDGIVGERRTVPTTLYFNCLVGLTIFATIIVAWRLFRVKCM